MYSGELEVQAKRKALAVLQDEITKILNSARDLSTLTSSLIKGDDKEIQMCLERMRNTEEEVENLRRKITREVAEIGSLMANREDILRTAYIIDDIAGYISGVAFRLANMKTSSLKKASFDDDLKQLVSMVVERSARRRGFLGGHEDSCKRCQLRDATTGDSWRGASALSPAAPCLRLQRGPLSPCRPWLFPSRAGRRIASSPDERKLSRGRYLPAARLC